MGKFKKYINLEALLYLSIILLFNIIVIMAINNFFEFFISIKLILGIIPLILFFIILYKIKLKDKKHLYLLVLLLISTIIQIINLLFISDLVSQVSDFGVHFNNAIIEKPNFSNALHFYHWAMLSKVFSFFTFIFGKTQLSAILFINFITLINVILIYLLSFLIFKKTSYAFLSGLLYLFWPSVILYRNIFSTEHIAITLILVSIILFILFEKGFNNNKKLYNFLLSITIGITLSFLKFFKPISIIIIIAIIIYYLFYEIIYKRYKNISKFKVCCLISIIIFYGFTNCIFFNYIDNLVGKKVNRNPTSFYLYMGLSPTNPRLGLYSTNVVLKYNTYYNEFDGNFKLIEKALYQDLKNEYKNNYNMFPKIINNKFRKTWENDIASLFWVTESIKQPEKLPINQYVFINILKVVSQFYYIILIILFLVGVYNCFLNSKNINYLFLLTLFIVGVLLMLLLSETQGRYKIIIYPFITIIATNGLFVIKKWRLK